ncbi:MAG: Glycerate dehydrogenase [Phycisphaerae bacterium]|nr:Glycerate dehydrogenase [Phycisphaerae bacterium]
MKIVCLDGYALNPGDLSWAAFEKLGDFAVHDRTPADAIIGRARGADALLTNKTPLSADTLGHLDGLRYVGVLATGYNVVDVAAARARGVAVTNVPTYGTDAVAQFTFALLLELCHRVGFHANTAQAGRWSECPDFCYFLTPQVELAGATMGVVGTGRIGRRVIHIALALGMKVLAADPHREPALPAGAGWADLDELFAAADVVSLHTPLTPQSERLVDARRLATMKPTAMLINTARGPLVDERALADALAAGRLAGAAVDVLTVEPPPADNPLLKAPNCLVTPHMAWSAQAARRRLMATAADNLAAFLAGRPVNVVNP